MSTFAVAFEFTGCGGPRLEELESGWAVSFFRVASALDTTTSRSLLRGNAPVGLLLGLLLAKSLMWAFSLSSGTSGGVLAPLLMIGAALGESLARLAHMPGETQALWRKWGWEPCYLAHWVCL